jgi:hypothetical protein
MTIQRQYSLPNCTLVLEGISDGSGNPMDLRPVMSILTSAECRLMNQVMRGGKDFFEGLVATVSLYAQEVLSGIRVPVAENAENAVNLKQLGPDRHQLTFAPAGGTVQTLDLNTVQLFDLVEAIDQFIADSQTLPQWSLGLKPASKKFAPKEPVSKQAMPIATGLGSLILAAAAFAAMPTPKVNQPADLTLGVASVPSSPNASPTPIAPRPNATPSPQTSTSPSPDLSANSKITDKAQLEQLGAALASKLQEQFAPAAAATAPMVYRVSVNKDGEILGYRPEGEAAGFVDQTPLAKLSFKPVPGTETTAELGDFRVTFKPDGGVDVQPWDAPVVAASSTAASPSASPSASASPSPQASASPSPIAQSSGPINDADKLKELQPKLYDQLDQAWKKPLSAKANVVYLVRVNGEGKIIDFAPSDSDAVNHRSETPLPQLGKEGGLDGNPSEAHARFKVVFTPGGQLEVNPWDGYAAGQ